MLSVASLEYLVSDFSIFEKINMIRRLSDMYGKVVNGQDIVFPKNPMLHILDNFDHSHESTDSFDLNKYPFLNNRSNIKYLHNFMQFEKVDKRYLDKISYRLYRSKLTENVRDFSLLNRKAMIPLMTLDTVLTNKNCIIVENYNPIYRILLTNQRPINQYYRYQAIFSTVLQNVASYDRQHFLVIPVDTNFNMKRSNVVALSQSEEMSPQKLTDTSHFYFFMLDLVLLLLDNNSKISTFNVLSARDISKLNVVLIKDGKCIIFNIGKLATLFTNNAHIFNFINVISTFSGSIIHNTSDTITEVTDIEEPVDNEETFSDVVDIPINELESYYKDKLDLKMILQSLLRGKYRISAYGIRNSLNTICASALIVRDFFGRILSTDSFIEDEKIRLITNVYTEPKYRKRGFIKSILTKVLKDNEPPIYLKVNKDNSVAFSIYESLGFKETQFVANDADSRIMGYGIQEVNQPVKTVLPIVKKTLTKSFLLPKAILPKKELISNFTTDNPKTSTIIDRVIISDKQKIRIETLADKYKSIKVETNQGKKTIEDILSTKVDINIKPSHLNVSHNGEVDPTMIHSSTRTFDEDYRNNLLGRDIINNVVCFRDNGLFLTNYQETNNYNDFTRVKHVKAVFTDIKNKQHTISFKIPMPDSEGYYLVNGVRLSMSKQLVNVPICKISPTRVSLISNYNKTLVDKVQSVRYAVDSYLAKQADKLGITLVPKSNTYVGIKLPYEYKLFGKSYSKIITSDFTFFFEYRNRFEFFGDVKDLEETYGVVIGKFNNDGNILVFIDDAGNLSAIDKITLNRKEISKHIVDCFGDFQVTPEWCDLKILDKNIPIGFILSYRYGISKVLTNLKVDYRFVDKNTRQRITRRSTEIAIEFEDGWLVFDRYPLINSYIISGLAAFPTLSNYKFIDLDGKDAYYGLISEKGMSMNYLKGIDNYFSFFIDPITKDVLQEMGEPTNTRDLLIRAVDLLINDTDKAPSSINNFRLRSAEKIPAMIYNEIARQYANYINSEFKDVSFSINTEAIFQRLIQDETMNLREDINPIHSVKEVSRVTHAGFGGRSSQAFVSRDRKYAKDAVGVISETTTDSGSVGMVSALSSDPQIKNLRGMFNTEENLNSANILSDVSLLMPGSMHDDPKRANFSNIQLSHHVPTKNLKPSRLRTGYEMVIPYKTNDFFVGRAKNDGEIVVIDDKLKLVKVQYKNGEFDIFEYGDIPGESSGSLINHQIALHPNVKPGAKFKKDNIITYHQDFFQLDPVTKNVSWCHGVPTTMAVMPKDITLEDSSMISSDLAEKLELTVINPRVIQISSDMIIESFAKIGTHVKYNDTLIELKYEDTADIIDDVDDLFLDLRQVAYRSKNEGEIVGIQIFYVNEQLNQSLTQFANKITFDKRAKARLAKNSLKEAEFTPVNIVPEGTRVKGVQLSSSDILIIFHIKSPIGCGIGDKIVAGNMLKSVVGKIENNPMTTEDGEPIDIVFGAISIFDRIVLSVFINGISDRIIQKAEEDIVKMYFG